MQNIKLRCLLFLLTACLLVACDTLSGLASFVNCKYEFQNVSDPSVGTVNLTKVANVKDISPTSMFQLTASILAGRLPFSTVINVQATNPNATAAKIEGLDWSLDQSSKSIITGSLAQEVNIPAKGVSTIPIRIEMDLMQIFKGESKDNIFGFVNSVLNFGTSQSDLALRINPKIRVAGQVMSPGYISIK